MNNNKPTNIDKNRQAIAGIQKHFANVPTLLLDGVQTPTQSVVAALQAAIDAIDVTRAAETARHTAVAAEQAAKAKAAALRAALKILVFNQLGATTDAVTDFGFAKPKKARTPTVAVKAEAVAKRATTRAARHTAGKRQKATVKGETPSPEPTAPAAPATPTKPA